MIIFLEKPMSFSDNIWLYGSETAPALTRGLQVGTLSADFIEGEIRNITLGATLILQRIYSAVRDENWGTIAGTLRLIEDTQTDNSLRLVFDSIHQHGNIDFRWRGSLTLTPTSLTFTMDGTAHTTFKRNRIGFCVLHDAAVAGSPCQIEFVDGTQQAAHFPKLISTHQPYLNLSAITHMPLANVQVTVRMEGDTFEMEDQRNWTDASFKTYCTPLGLPFPVTIEEGAAIQQKITLTCMGDIPAAAPIPETTITITPTNDFSPMPSVGTRYRGDKLTKRQTQLFKQLSLDHLRVDIDLAKDNIPDLLDNTAALLSSSERWQVELALWLHDNPENELRRFAALIESHTYFSKHGTFTVFGHGYKATPEALMTLAETILPKRAIYGGTDAFFTELNRNRPDTNNPAYSGISYSINPQVHAFDNDSLIETLAMQGETLRSTRAFVKPSWHIKVSPVSLKMRWNPNATGTLPVPHPDELPPHADPRQMTLFAAAWTVGSLKHHAENGAHSVTYYDLHGYDGLIPSANGSLLPHLFPDVREVYPLYHVFTALGQPGEVQHTQSSKPLKAEALYMWSGDKLRVMVANYTPHPQTVTLEGLSGTLRGKELGTATVESACADPDSFLDDWQLKYLADETDGKVTLKLSPYAVIFLEQAD